LLKLQIVNGWTRQNGGTASRFQIASKTLKPRPKCGDFSIFKDGGRRHLGFLKLQFLTGRLVKRVELRHRAKFRQNRSKCDGDMAIFRFFNDGRRHLEFLKYVNFMGEKSQESQNMPNFASIGQTVAEIWRFFDCFQDGGRPPSWICDECVWTTHEGHLVVFIAVQNMQNLVGIDAVVLIMYMLLLCYVFQLHQFGWKTPIHAPKIGILEGGFDPLNGEAYQRNPQKAHPWERRHMSYRSSKSVHWCDLCA